MCLRVAVGITCNWPRYSGSVVVAINIVALCQISTVCWLVLGLVAVHGFESRSYHLDI